MIVIWTLLAFLSGGLMFSYWLGLLANHNLKEVGDGNPGALNLWQAAGYSYGLCGILLDFLKGYVPIFWLIQTDAVTGYELVLPCAAAVLGHMFSPFMKLRGGKAIAVTFGVWSALTAFTASLAYAIILAILLLTGRLLNKGKPTSSQADGFQVVLGMLVLTIFVILFDYSGAVISFGIVNLLLLLYSHRRELRRFISALELHIKR
ncbi:acyl-phosphate glycerol 3-phosphate acyltransferase [Paenibacillus taihuensis]|uniref:Glycerol-3-phosphate acyltransferase n=1 Tax=Paenibacillus taihuensis TaxID=1156355 RepID=A0A3D9RNY1_9BACL|nr:glycerol-3-phosphate acyltransferase [Paenibacillus taihuensis]REE81517.1 acyl-phosphate glycerol 3-phosphate acyltransferase [Paenibacillus taihuensis]